MLCVVFLVGIFFLSLPAFDLVNSYTTRYVIAGCAGLVVLAAHTLRGLSNRSLIFTALAVGLYALKPVAWNNRYASFSTQRAAMKELVSHQASFGAGPLVYGEFGKALPLLHYLPEEMKPFVIVDPEQAIHYTGNNTGDLGAQSLMPEYPTKLIGLSDFLSRPQTSTVYTTPEHPQWLIPYLQESGYKVELLALVMSGELFQVSK